MSRRMGLSAPCGAAIAVLACLFVLQASAPTVVAAKRPEIATVTGDPDDGNHRQFTDVLPNQPPETLLTKPTMPVEPEVLPLAPQETRLERSAGALWRIVAEWFATLACRMVLEF